MSSPQPQAVVPGSDRVRLAALAREAALSVDAVTGSDAGPAGLMQTVSGTGIRVPGVRVVAAAGQRYSVELGLRVRLVPLNPLADAVRERVTNRAARDGLSGRLGPISVTFYAIEENDVGETSC